MSYDPFSAVDAAGWVLYSLLFWSKLSPWGRRRIVAPRRTVVEERPVRVIEEQPVEVIEERPLDDGLP